MSDQPFYPGDRVCTAHYVAGPGSRIVKLYGVVGTAVAGFNILVHWINGDVSYISSNQLEHSTPPNAGPLTYPPAAAPYRELVKRQRRRASKRREQHLGG